MVHLRDPSITFVRYVVDGIAQERVMFHVVDEYQ